MTKKQIFQQTKFNKDLKCKVCNKKTECIPLIHYSNLGSLPICEKCFLKGDKND